MRALWLVLALLACGISAQLITCSQSASDTSELNNALAACEDAVFVFIELTGVTYDGPITITNATHVVLNGSLTNPVFTNAVINVQDNDTAVYLYNLFFNGQDTTLPLFSPPLRCNNNLTIVRCNFYHYHGTILLNGEAGDENVALMVLHSTFFDIWGAALYFSGLNGYVIGNTTFARCGGLQYSCVFLKQRWGADGDVIIYDSVHYLLWDEQPPPCVSYLDPFQHIRCDEGKLMCEDLSATLAADDCETVPLTMYDPVINATRTEMVYNTYCRRYRPCTCENALFQDISNSTRDPFALAVGDLIYTTTRIECLAGSSVVSGGSLGNTALVVLSDPSFEQTPAAVWTYSPLASQSNVGGDANTGQYVFRCEHSYDAQASQTVTFPQNGTYIIAVWMRRRKGTAAVYVDYPLQLTITQGVTVLQSSAISGPSMSSLLGTAGVYVRGVFPAITLTAGVYTLSLGCQWKTIQTGGGGGGELRVYIDDIFSLAGGIEFIEFPAGLGTGPPPNTDPLDSIALPLSSNAALDFTNYQCPLCPTEPLRPADLPCVYDLASNFSCYRTIKSGRVYCLTPSDARPANGAFLFDSSFETSSNLYWTVNSGSLLNVVALNNTAYSAHDGAVVVRTDPVTFDLSIVQAVNVTVAGFYSVQSWIAQYDVISAPSESAPTLALWVGGSLSSAFVLSTLLNATYVKYQLGPAFFDTGLHTVELRITGNTLYDATLYMDSVQFSSAVQAANTPSPTPSFTPTPSMTPSNSTLNNTIANTTVAVDPAFLSKLYCSESVVKLGNTTFSTGCILPADAMIGTRVYGNTTVSVAAGDCLFDDQCTIPASFSVDMNGFTVDCVAGIAMMCDCSLDALQRTLLNHSVDNDTAGFELDNIQPTNRRVFITNVRAQGLPWGMITRRTQCDTIRLNSVALVDMFDEQCVGREISKVNKYLWGRVPDNTGALVSKPAFLMDALPLYEEQCIDMCEQFNPYVGTFAMNSSRLCIVDNAGSDLTDSPMSGAPRRFTDLQVALDTSDCRRSDSWIVVLESENFYEGDFVLTSNTVRLFSPDGATIVGTIEVRGNVDELFIRGFNFVHGGRNGQPLIDISSAGDLRNLTIQNCNFDGVAIKNAGIINNRNRRVRDVDFRYNRVANFLGTSFRVNVDNVIASHNTFERCSGRAFQVRYRGTFRVEHNVLRETRGSGNIEKAVLIELQHSGTSVGPFACEERGQCVVRNNVQVVANAGSVEDYKEVGILLRGGRFWIEDVRDNFIVKARTGMRFRGAELIAPDNTLVLDARGVIELMQYYNPGVRPSRTRSESKGEDFMVDGFVGGVRFGTTTCAFPQCTDVPFRPQRCIANLNFDPLNSNRFGWETFQNTTQASFYCPLNLVEVTAWGGARIIPERLDIVRPYSDNLLFPLRDTTTIQQIILGQRPVPSRFVVEGRLVTASDIVFFLSLLDSPLRYGLGVPMQVYDRTDLVCNCGVFFFRQRIINCTDRYFTDCDAYSTYTYTSANGTNATVPVTQCTTVNLDCTLLGWAVFGSVSSYTAHSCQWSLELVLDTSAITDLTNGSTTLTVLVPQPPELNVPDLEECTFSYENRTRLVYGLESTVNTCFPPAYYGVGSQYRALNITWRDVAFYLHYGVEYDADEIGAPMLQSLDNAVEQVFERVLFDGRGAEAPGPTNAVQLMSGLDAVVSLGRKKAKRIPPIASSVSVNECVFRRFLFYESVLNNAEQTPGDADELSDFPYINAMQVTFINTNFDDPTTFTMDSTNGSLIDRRFLDVRFANATYLRNSSCVDCGGRSLDNSATVYIEANKNSPNALIHVTGNLITQTRTVSYPYLGDLAIPGFTSHLWITGLSPEPIDACTALNLTIDQCDAAGLDCCPTLVFCNNTISGVSIGARLVEVSDSSILLGLPAGTVLEFTDSLSLLRELARCNNNGTVEGTFCDIIRGPPYKDWRRENECCNGLCVPPDPPVCRFNLSDPSIAPWHRWYNRFWFDDINTGIEQCAARRRQLNIEAPAPVNTCYDVRLNATVNEPAIIQYRGRYTSRFEYTLLGTNPINTPSPEGDAVVVRFDDDSGVAPMQFELLAGVLLLTTSNIEVSMSTTLPTNSAVGVPLLSPVDWLVTIDIVFTFDLPPNTVVTLPLVPAIEYSINYTSPVQALANAAFSWLGTAVFSWNWVEARATLVTDASFSVVGIGSPCLRCNAHSVNAYALNVRSLRLQHADACAAPLFPPLDLTTCPCTLDSAGAATWQQRTNDTSIALHWRRVEFDGEGTTALAVDGIYGTGVTLDECTFGDYAGDNVVRMTGANCSEPTTVSLVKTRFFGSPTRMRGNIVALYNVTGYTLDECVFSDVSFRSLTATPLAMFYAQRCELVHTPIVARLNREDNTANTQTNLINGCYYTAYYLDGLRKSDTVVGNECERRNNEGAAVCIRIDNMLSAFPSKDCQSPLRRFAQQNPLALGVRHDIAYGVCTADDTCLDSVCLPDDECRTCSRGCPQTYFPVWYALVALPIALLILLCCGCTLACLVPSMEMRPVLALGGRMAPIEPTLLEDETDMQAQLDPRLTDSEPSVGSRQPRPDAVLDEDILAGQEQRRNQSSMRRALFGIAGTTDGSATQQHDMRRRVVADTLAGSK